MSSDRKAVTAFITLICGLLLLIVGLLVHWPLWAWLVATASLVTPTLVMKATADPPDLLPREFLPDPNLPCPQEKREQRISEVQLPSKLPDYDFLFSATVRWCPVDTSPDAPVINAMALAVNAVLVRASEITSNRSPDRSTLTQRELDAALGRMEPDANKYVLAMAQDVTLALSPHDQDRLDKLAAVRKDEDVWNHARRHEQSKRTYLGKDVLKDTGSAVVWWLARNDDRIDKVVNDIGTLAQLSSAANNKDMPMLFEHLVPGLIPSDPESAQMGNGQVNGVQPAPRSATDAFRELLGFMKMGDGDPRRPLFTGQVAYLIAKQGEEDIAAELRNEFDVLPDPPSPNDRGSEAGEQEDGEEGSGS